MAMTHSSIGICGKRVNVVNVMGIVVNPAYGYDTFFYWYMWKAG
jgi:hypothetical protein